MSEPRRQPAVVRRAPGALRLSKGAFTLLELLVALAMTAVLAGSLYATLHVAFRAQRTALAAVDEVRKVELAVELIRADLESAVVPKGILAGAFIGEDGADQRSLPNDVLTLHAAASGTSAAEGRGDIRMVEFACESAGEGRGMNLLRRVTWNLLSTRALQAEEEVLCRDVRSFDVKYFDGVDWFDYWDSTLQDNTLPLAVQVSLELIAPLREGQDDKGQWVTRVFRLPCSSLTSGLQVEMSPGGMP